MSAPAATTSSSSLPPPTSSSAAHQPEANNASQQQQQQQQQQPQPPGFTPRDPSHAWEAVDGSSLWHDVQEDAHGNILLSSSTAHLSLASQIRQRRHRLASTDISLRSHRLVRHMLRHVYLVLDASRWSREKDASLPPAKVRLETILNLSVEFVNQFYDQNPLGHLGVVLCKDGEAEMLAGLGGGGPGKVKLALGAALVSEMKLTGAKGGGKGTAIGGEFSLQNGIEVAGRSLGYAPRYGSREIVVITSALSTCDPGDILGETLPRLLRAGIRVSTVALQAELHVCKTLADRTGGLAGVCLDRRHLRDLVMGHAVPPPVNARQLNEDEDAGADHDNNSRNNANGQPQMICEFVTMGFPSREGGDVPTLVHNTGGAGGLNDKHGGGGGAVAFAINPAAADDRRSNRLISFARSGYVCPRCRSRCSDLPSDCAVCGLRLILAPHLARTFHHLFPVRPFLELEDAEVVSSVASGLMLEEEEEELKNVKDEGDGELQQIKSQPQPLLQKSQQHTNGKKGLEALPILSSSAYTPISSLSSSCVESFVVTSSSTSMDVPIDNQMSSTNHNNDNNIHTPISKVINIGPSIIANSADCDRCCFGCLKIIGCKPLNAANINGSSSASTTTENTNNRDVSNPTTTAKEAESILRFQCPECLNVFCPDCDAYLHETLHNCPGCLCN